MLIETLLIGSALYVNLKILRKKKTSSSKVSKMLLSSRKKKLVNPLIPTKARPTTERPNRYYFQLSAAATGISGLALIAPILQLVSFSLLIYLCTPILQSTITQWRNQKKLGHDMLVSVLACISLISGQLAALAIALFFYYLGKKLLAQTQNHSKAMLVELFIRKPEKVWVIKNGVELEISLEHVCVNDQVVVNTGDVIPIDGMIVEGMAIIDQHTLTGELQPVEKSREDRVFASTQIISGRIIVWVEKTGADTTVTKICEMINHTADYKVALLSKGEAWADQIAMPLIVLSVAIEPILGLVGSCSVLNSTFGNRLQLTAPLSVLNHLNLATKKGILVKDGRALETLSRVDALLFDKTGTLTEEQPSVGRIFSCAEDYQEEKLLVQAAAAELKLAHPIANAIVEKARSAGLILPTISESDFQIGLGVTIIIDNKIVRVGSQRFIQQNGIAIPETMQQMMETVHAEGHSMVLVASDNELKGLIEIIPSIRPEIKYIIKELRQQGMQYIAIVSGDHEKPTQALARQLGIDAYFAEVMPEDKANIVNSLQQRGHTVCFIGDGINDAAAIKKADVSISIDGATSIARDLAQIVLMDGSLKRLCELFEIAFSLEKNIKSTLKTLYVPILINLSGALFFGFSLMATVLINNTSLLLALRKTKQHSLVFKEYNNSQI